MSSVILFFQKQKRTLLLTLFAVLLLFCPVQQTHATGMAVMDIQAILTAINNFQSTLQQYQRQIQQWTAEAQRIATAAKAISEGQYQQGIQGLLASANSIANNLNTYLGDSTALEIMQAINAGYEWGVDMRDFSDLLDQSTDKLESLYGDLDFSDSSGWDVVNDVLDTTMQTVNTVGYVTNRGIDAIARNTAVVMGETAGALNQATGISDKVRELQEQITKNQQDIANKTNELQRAIRNGEDATAEGLQLEIDTLEKNNDMLIDQMQSYSNQLQMAIDAEDQATAAKAEQIAKMEAMIRNNYQTTVIKTMEQVAGNDETWLSFVEEVSDGNMNSDQSEIMLNSLESYYNILNSKKAEEQENNQNKGWGF